MKTFICALVIAFIGTGAAIADAPRIAFAGLDTSAPLESNLDALNDVRSATDAPNFSEVWSGVTPSGMSVMLGINAKDLQMVAASMQGHFGPNDRAQIASLEQTFGLTGLQRTVGDCGKAAGEPAIECSAVFYECPTSPPLCHITLFSFGSEAGGLVRVSWAIEPIDLTSPQ